jgi:hypothetical protein
MCSVKLMTDDRCHGKKKTYTPRANRGIGGGTPSSGGGANHKNIPNFYGYFRPSPGDPAVLEQCFVIDGELFVRVVSPLTARHFIKILMEFI